ncbi:hypothetical protein BCR35DRAFT_306092 [Leucosporidium creatinivorum]|uniref:Zn(2)-C6 fungal-type domain-containing protein n=1 Tax=Leucosporidium creatinivorum TaxID=106004 RepID=A0A1Y2EWT4_9BASI|nr:hypothetical protein BCR35DRAFT_306092 [Leucosporidium creatinivorum]
MDKIRTTISTLSALISEEYFVRPSRQRGDQPPVAASCGECKRAKSKCLGDRVAPCPRCVKHSFDCIYPIRKPPGRSRGFGRRAILLTEARTNLEEALASLDPSAPSTSTPIASTSRLPIESSARTSMSVEDEEQDEEADVGDYPELGNPLSLLASISLHHDGGPVSQAPQDEFQAWLASAQRYYGTELYRPRYDTDPMSDPVVLGLLTEADLARLVNLYFDKLRPFLWHLNRSVHTPNFLRDTSPFLTTAVAAVAAMYDPLSSHLVVGLQAHAEWLSCRVFANSFRSREIAYAYLLISHWAPPGESWDDDRSWRWVGEAIRIAQELRLDRPLDEAAFAEYKARTSLADDLFTALAEDHALGWSLFFMADLAISVHSGRMAAFSALKLAGGLRGDLPVPSASDSSLYSCRANEVLNRRFAKALVLLGGLQEEKGSKADFRDAFTASWKEDLSKWQHEWPAINTFIAVHAQHVRLALLSASLSLPGPTRPLLEECQNAALTLVSLVANWSEDADDSLLFASNYAVTNIAFGATLLLKFLNLSDLTQKPDIRVHVLDLCSKVVAALLRVAGARVNSPSMASIHAARIHSLLLTFAAPPPAPAPAPALDIDATLNQLDMLPMMPMMPFDEFTLGVQGSTASTLLSSLDSGGDLDWGWEGWNF